MSYRFVVTLIACFCFVFAQSQEPTDTGSVANISESYFNAINKKAGNLSEELDKKGKRVLARMQKEEVRLQKKIAKIDSLAANNIFSNSAEKYNELQEKLNNKAGKLSQYIPKLDSLATSLKFLEQHPEFIDNIKDAKEKLDDVSDRLKEFQSKLQGADDIKKFLKERREYLKQQLEKFGFAKELKKFNKEVYYFSQQINEYKEIFKDSKKAERKALELLSKTKLFKDFMKKNSMLASLFPMPSGGTNNALQQPGFAALQTRGQLNNFVQQAGMNTSNGGSLLQRNINNAQDQVSQLRSKLDQLVGGSGGDLELPDFKYNSQRTKSFFKRIEIVANFQTIKSDRFFPTTSDIAVSAGYKLNDKSIIGIGLSHKLGWGNGWNNIKITHQGIGLRSFADIKLKGSFWISGGYEMNYKEQIRSIMQLKDHSLWQTSGLIGMSKIISVKRKMFKKTRAQLLWDFLSYRQQPRPPALLFRIGYNF